MIDADDRLRTLIVDDEPLAVERLQVLCARMEALQVVGTASDGAAALRLAGALRPDLVLLDLTMPEMDGLEVARRLTRQPGRPAIIFVTAHDNHAVEAFDLDAVDYLLKPVSAERLARAVERVSKRRALGALPAGTPGGGKSDGWLRELWIPHRSELLRVPVDEVTRIDAERDYVRLHLGERSFLLLQTLAGLEERLDPSRFVRIHRSTVLRRDCIRGLRHDGMGAWSVECANGDLLRIGRTYLPRVKAMAGR